MTTGHSYNRHAFCAVIVQDEPHHWETAIYAGNLTRLKSKAERLSLVRERAHPNHQVDISYFRWNRLTRKWKSISQSASIVISARKELASTSTSTVQSA